MNIAYPWTELQTGTYEYRMPGWAAPVTVKVEDGQGAFAGQLMVRFKEGYYPTKLRDIPVAAEFVKVSAPSEAPQS